MKLLKIIFYATLSLLVVACSEHCGSDCQAPKENAPVISLDMVKDFAKQNVILMPHGEYLKIVLPADKFFKANSPTIKKDQEKNLQPLADLIKQYGSQATVKIMGFTDTIADNGQNQKLSLERARSILAYFWSQGLDAEHLYPVGLGDQHLVADPNNVAANAANRRVEIVVHAHCTTCF